jgi:hypothetical protein
MRPCVPILLLLLLAACHSHDTGPHGLELRGHAEEVVDVDLDLRDGDLLSFETRRGSVEIQVRPGATPKLSAHLEVRARNDEEARAVLRSYRLEVTRQSSILQVHSEGAPSRVQMLDSSYVTLETEVSFRAVVPVGTRLRIETGAGRIEVDGRAHGVEAHTAIGGVRIVGTHGPCLVRVGSGTVEVDEVVTESCDVVATSGRVTIDGVLERLEAHTGSGSLTVRARPGSSVEDDWRLDSGSGAIDLEVPDDLSARLDAETGSGLVLLEFPLSGRVLTGSAARVEGDIGSGGPRLRVNTGSGRIRIALVDT